jgi:hypothetical protein
MALEHWDPIRKQWLLYRSDAQHGVDCKSYPLEMLPRRIFLDTCVVNLLVKHAADLFEQGCVPSSVDPTRADDLEALMHIYAHGRRGPWHLFASKGVLHEISNTPDGELRADLADYAIGLVEPTNEDARFASDFGRRLADSEMISAFPHRADRELIGHAIALQCDVFCTSDRRSIVRKRDVVDCLPLRVLTPVEWWAHLKPWAALYA